MVVCPKCSESDWKPVHKSPIDPAEDRFKCACGHTFKRYDEPITSTPADVPSTAAIKAYLKTLIQESDGVAGWHRNGDVAEWDSFSDLIAWVNAD